jgi:hypothetical protein
MRTPTLVLSPLLLLAAHASAQLSYVTSPKGYDTLEGNVSFFNWGPSRRLQGIDNTLKGMIAVFKELALRRDGAPEVLARALGWFVGRLDGTPVPYNQENPNHDEFLVCRPAARERTLAALRRAGAVRRPAD